MLDLLKQIGIVRWHNEANHEDTDNIEDQDSPEDTPGGLGDSTARVFGFRGG